MDKKEFAAFLIPLLTLEVIHVLEMAASSVFVCFLEAVTRFTLEADKHHVSFLPSQSRNPWLTLG